MVEWLKNPRVQLFLGNLLTALIAFTLAVFVFNSIDMDSTTTNLDVLRYIAFLWWLYIGFNVFGEKKCT